MTLRTRGISSRKDTLSKQQPILVSAEPSWRTSSNCPTRSNPLSIFHKLQAKVFQMMDVPLSPHPQSQSFHLCRACLGEPFGGIPASEVRNIEVVVLARMAVQKETGARCVGQLTTPTWKTPNTAARERQKERQEREREKES